MASDVEVQYTCGMRSNVHDKAKRNLVEKMLAAHLQSQFQEAVLLHRKGKLAQAQAIYIEILEAEPRHSDALHLLGVVAAQTGNAQRAVELITQAITLNPNNAAFYSNRGNALKDLNQPDAAVESYEKAIALKPDYAEAYYNRGDALKDLRQLSAAIESYDRAVAVNPYYAKAYSNRGNALMELGRLEAAIVSFDKAIAIKPDYAEAYSNRSAPLLALKRYQEAIASFDKAMATNPSHKFLSGARLNTKMQICDWGDVEEEIAELTQNIRQGNKSSAPFEVLALTSSLPVQRKAAEIWANEKYPPDASLAHIPKHAKGKKIRLGYFSMDFKNHPVAYLTAGLFETHDREKFEVFAFSFGFDGRDEMRARLELAFDKFIDVKDKSDMEIAELVRKMQIDIAVDLSGYTGDSRTGIFVLRAAPMQVNYLGYPGTMGVDYIDYLIADRQLITEEAQTHYAEKIVYLPDTYMTSDAKRCISDKNFDREELGLPQTGFVYCCFNNSYKIIPSTFDGWMRILKQVEGSVLWLSENNPVASINLRKEAVQRGVDPQRLVFAERLPSVADHLARHRAADLFIDTLPYNAHTTASDALWAGLPVLTCTGQAFASRVAASLLSAIDLPELITHTQEDYEALAIELATNPQRLKVIKEKLARNRLTTPLFDTKLFTSHLEDAYSQMYERYHADLAPDHIYVGQQWAEPNLGLT